MNGDIGPSPEQQLILDGIWNGYIQNADKPNYPLFTYSNGVLTVLNYTAKHFVLLNSEKDVLTMKDYANTWSLMAVQDILNPDNFELDLPIRGSAIILKSGWYTLELTKFNDDEESFRFYISVEKETVFPFDFKNDPTKENLEYIIGLNEEYLKAYYLSQSPSTIIENARIRRGPHHISIENILATGIVYENPEGNIPSSLSMNPYQNGNLNPRGIGELAWGNWLIQGYTVTFTRPGTYKFHLTLINNETITIEKNID